MCVRAPFSYESLDLSLFVSNVLTRINVSRYYPASLTAPALIHGINLRIASARLLSRDFLQRVERATARHLRDKLTAVIGTRVRARGADDVGV